MFAFANLWRPAATAELSAVDREQVVAAARQHDGTTHTPEVALSMLHQPERWDVLAGERARYQVWITGVDSGVVFHARSDVIVGDIIRFGFACNDLLAWSELATATLSERARDSTLAMVDFALDPAAGPTLFRLGPDHPAAALWRDDLDKLALGPGWRELVAQVAHREPAIHALITGATQSRRSPRHGIYGLASHYPAALVRDLAPRFARRPAGALLDELAAFVDAAAREAQDVEVCLETTVAPGTP
ncbi:MAG: hypothetical protein WKG01_22300 [Kofleriaceae bacterium]